MCPLGSWYFVYFYFAVGLKKTSRIKSNTKNKINN